MALLPDVIPCEALPIPIEGCLASFVQSQAGEGAAALATVLTAMKKKSDSELESVCARITGLTNALALTRVRSEAIEQICLLVAGIKQAISEFRENLFETTGADCPELSALEVLIDAFKAALVAESQSLNIPGTEDILAKLNALKVSFGCQSTSFDQLLSLLGG